MRERVERLVVLPFSLGCASHSSVELGAPAARPKADAHTTIVPSRGADAGEKRSFSFSPKMKTSPRRPSSNISALIHRLIRGIKSLSQFFFYREDHIIEEEMELAEMEIGYPTDVKHVTHVGLDGSTTTNPINNVKGWDNLNLKAPAPPELLAFSSTSFKQFEVEHAMAIQPLFAVQAAIG